MNRRARTHGRALQADPLGAFVFRLTIYSHGVPVGFRLVETWS